jgi:hypothetical protein
MAILTLDMIRTHKIVRKHINYCSVKLGGDWRGKSPHDETAC